MRDMMPVMAGPVKQILDCVLAHRSMWTTRSAKRLISEERVGLDELLWTPAEGTLAETERFEPALLCAFGSKKHPAASITVRELLFGIDAGSYSRRRSKASKQLISLVTPTGIEPVFSP